MKDVGGQVLGQVAVANAACDKGIHAFKMLVVKLGKPGWIVLRCLDQEALALQRAERLLSRRFRCRFSDGHLLSHLHKLATRQKVTPRPLSQQLRTGQRPRTLRNRTTTKILEVEVR